jgi:peptide/nickel transport system permease protein
LLGLIGGYKQGWIDVIIQRPVDALIAIPSLILALGIVAALGPSVWAVTAAIAVGLIPRSARIIRSVVLSVRGTDYVMAAGALGCSDLRIMFRHILPNVMASFIIIISIYLGWAIIVESSLSFLGLGVPPANPSWGQMLSRALDGLRLNPVVAIVPGLTISLTVLGFNLFGDALRDSLDPRLRGQS